MTEVDKLVSIERDRVSLFTVLGKHRGRSFAMNGVWRNAEKRRRLMNEYVGAMVEWY